MAVEVEDEEERDRRNGLCYGRYCHWHWCLTLMLQSTGSVVSQLIF